MFDYQSFSYDGKPVSYAVIPKYMIDVIMLDDRITLSALKIFMRLMTYASAVNSCRFKITHAWLEKNTALSPKTVARALAQLKSYGYVNDDGIVYSAPPQEAKRATVKQSLTVQPVPSVQVHHIVDANDMIETKQDQSTDFNNTDQDIASELNDILRSLGSVKKVKTTGQIVQSTGQNSQSSGQNSHPYITIPKNNLLENTPTVPAEKPATKKPTQPADQTGLLFSASQKGFVEPSKPKPLASFLPTLGKGATVAIGKPTTVLSPQHESYIRSALTRMNVTSPSERQRYTTEIAYAATQGAFSETYRHTPLKAIRACLNLVEAGKWRANGGMYA